MGAQDTVEMNKFKLETECTKKMGKCFFDLLLSFASLQFHKLMKSKRYERVNEEPGETARSKRIQYVYNSIFFIQRDPVC